MKIATLFMIGAMTLSPAVTATPVIIAHRGASGDAPENTLAAFKEAWNQNADGVELDIYLTKDGRIVVLHDASTKRTAGKDLAVKDHSLEELRALDAGVWKGEKWKNERIPMLEEVLEALPEGKQIYIEIKCGPEVLAELKNVISKSGRPVGQLKIIAFNFDALVKSKALMPEIKTLWLVSGSKDKATGKAIYPDLTELAEKTSAAGLSGLSLNLGFPLDAPAVAAIKARGLLLAVWTANDVDVTKRFAAAGVDAICTDHPAKIRPAL
jgi:glycerophosphoryl diester phosphodiesterase